MQKLVRPVEAELANYIEGLDYDVRALRELLCEAAERNLNGKDAYAAWEQKYLDRYSELCLAKSELEKEYVLPAAEGRKVVWNLDYGSQELTIREAEE